MAYTVKITDHLEDGGAWVRHTVFIDEQGFQEEIDEIDKTAYHLQMFDEGKVIGAGRIFVEEGTVWHIGRIAVLSEYRMKGVGRLIMSALESHAKSCGGTETVLSAQCRAAEFYVKCGYIQKGDVYFEEDCPHVLMVKIL